MRHYEIVFLVHPDQSEQVPAMLDKYREMVTAADGQVHRTEDWGRRRLAYSINDIHKAHYALINIECSLEVLEEIERNFRFNDSILRHLVVRRKAAETGESPLAKARAEEERQEDEKRKSAESRAAARKEDDEKPEESNEKDPDGDESTDQSDDDSSAKDEESK